MTGGLAATATAAGAEGGGPATFGTSGVCVRYGATLALDGVSLLARPGQVTVVVGGDGAGKTTLLRCLAGALAPEAGQVYRPDARRIGYQPAGSGTYPDLTADENLAFRAAAYRLPASLARSRADEYLASAGLTAARGRLAGQLSGGMRQKLGVIAAMLAGPDLLVLDEPTTGVDPVSRSDMWALIARAAAAGAAVVLATSYLDEAQRAEAVLFLDSGRVLAAGRPADIVASVPGSLRALPAGPAASGSATAWRRAGAWRVWYPPGQPNQPGQPGRPITPDLQDAVTIAALAREQATAMAEPLRLAPVGAASPASLPAAAEAPRPASGPLARCSAVSRRFGQFAAVREVSLAVGPGEIVGLLGANGAGKTTLIRMLLGLITPSEGGVALFGEPPSRGTRRRIGYVPQGLGLYDDLTPAENLEFSSAVFGTGPAGLPGPLRSYSAALTGRLPLGVQRRVAFAQALAHGPELLILDEPTSGVDPLGRARLWDTIRQAAQEGAGVLVTTHYLEEAQECGRLVIMSDGAVVAEGTAAGIIGDATVAVVDAPSWAAAFRTLTGAGLAVSLAGRTLRVPGASPAEVRQALGAAESRVTAEPATLEERFFQLTLPPVARGVR